VEYLQRRLLPAARSEHARFFRFEDGKPGLKKLADVQREHGAAIAAVKVADDDGTIEVRNGDHGAGPYRAGGRDW
jgi:hypothetical protein